MSIDSTVADKAIASTTIHDSLSTVERGALQEPASAADWPVERHAALPTPASGLQPVFRPSSGKSRAAWQRNYAMSLQITDLVVVTCAVVLAEVLRFRNTSANVIGHQSLDYSVVSILIIGGWIWFLAIYHTRAPRTIGAGYEEFRRVWSATLSLFGVIAIGSMLLKLEIARGYLAIALPVGLAGLTMARWASRTIVGRYRRRGRLQCAVLAVGDSQSVQALAKSLARHPEEGYTVVSACTPGSAVHGTLPVAGVGRIPLFPYRDNVIPAIEQCGADTVAVTSTGHLGPRGIGDLSWQLDKLDVDLLVSPGMVDVAGPRLMMRPVADLPLIQLAKPQYEGAKGFQKRAFDVCFTLMVLLLVSPFMLIAAAAVKLTSKGSVFYLSERIGLDGKPFRMIKFRTMSVDAEQRLSELTALNEVAGGVLFKMRNDPRVTPVGRILRRYSIDELPQFINVLRGDMSVVGPRPPLASEVQTYDGQVRRRLLVRPGITGLWQVSGRSDLSWEDSVRLDLFYIENWSMLNDFVIALKTVRAILQGAGAY